MASFEQGLILTCGSVCPFLAIGVGVPPLSSFICNYKDTTNNCKDTITSIKDSPGVQLKMWQHLLAWQGSKLVGFFLLAFFVFPWPSLIKSFHGNINTALRKAGLTFCLSTWLKHSLLCHSLLVPQHPNLLLDLLMPPTSPVFLWQKILAVCFFFYFL